MTPPIRVLEIRSVRGTGGGPEKTILLGAAKADPSRFKVTVCYLRDRRDQIFHIDRCASSLPVDYVEVLERHSFDPAIWPALRRLVRSRGIEIVHAHDYKTDLLALLLAHFENVIPLTTVHGWAGNSPKERVYYFFDRRLIRRYPIAIAVSEQIRRTLLEHGARADRVRRIRNGIDGRHFRRNHSPNRDVRSTLGLPTDAPLILGVGRLENEKRFDVLIEAIAVARTEVPTHVVLVGDGSCRAPLSARALAPDLSGRVHFVGHVGDVRPHYQACDVFVQSSDTEGIPNAVLEAMAMEVPIVATNVGGTSELVDDGIHGLLVPKGDSRAMADAIVRTLTDRESTRRRVAAARARVEHELSFDVRMSAVEAIYSELIATFGRGPGLTEDT